jgi:hypothetical protein
MGTQSAAVTITNSSASSNVMDISLSEIIKDKYILLYSYHNIVVWRIARPLRIPGVDDNV